jgi:starch synthase (maltosyl-transferring)
VGDDVVIEADCFADGHDVVACRLQWRRAGEQAWRSSTMQPLVNDRWRASFVVDALGSWEYTVCAWVDPFQSGSTTSRAARRRNDVRVAAVTGVR